MLITSLDNNSIKELKKLGQKKYRDETNTFLVETYHLIEEAYKKNLLVEVFLLEGSDIELNVKRTFITKEIMRHLTELDNHSYVIGVVRKKEEDELGDRILVLDNIQDPGNLGTIIRSSKAFNIDTIVLSNDTVDLYNPKVIRSTQGMLFYINIIKRDLFDFLIDLKKLNYNVFTTNVEAGEDIKNIDSSELVRYALVMGNEGNGVSTNLLELSDKQLYINTNKEVESLNVAVATSIILYEFNRR